MKLNKPHSQSTLGNVAPRAKFGKTETLKPARLYVLFGFSMELWTMANMAPIIARSDQLSYRIG